MWDARAATVGLRRPRNQDWPDHQLTRTQTHTHMSAGDEDIYLRGPVNVLGIDIDAPAARPRNPRRLQHHRPQRHTLGAAPPAGIFRYPTDDPSDLAEASSRIFPEPPPRNPRRLLQRRHHSQGLDWTFATASYPELQPVTDSESNSISDGDAYSSSPASNSKLASTYARRPPALDQISPPSSPETGAFKNVAPVSPIDEDDGGFNREYPVQGVQQSQPFTTQLQMSNGPIQVQYMPFRPAVDMYGASFENPRSVKDIPIPYFENPRSIKDVPIPQSSLPRSNKLRLHLTSENSVAQRFRFLAKGKSESPEPFTEQAGNSRSRAASRAGSSRPGSSKSSSIGYNGLRNISAPIPQSQPAFMMDSPPRQQMVTDRDLLPSTQARKPADTTTPAARVTPYDAYTTNASNGANALATPPNDQEYPTPPSLHSAQPQSPVDPNWTPTGPRIIKRKPAQNQQNQPPTNRSSSIPASLFPRPPTASAPTAAAPPPQPQAQPQPQPRLHPQPQPHFEGSYADEASMKPAPLFAHTTHNTWNTEGPWQAVGEQTPADTPPDASFLSRSNPDTAPDSTPSHTPTTRELGVRASSLYEAYAQMPRMPPQSEIPSSKRADPQADSETKAIKHKPTLSTTKPLPPAPPELASSSSDDRIAQLNATLAGLAHRKVNINKSIQQMTELMPRDNLMASEEVLRKREIEKQKVEGLKKELAEIQLEEYDLGLKLHRAYKRLNRGADYEPTTLWVRRVNT